MAGGVAAGTVLASAAAPVLPRQTPAQLIASLRQATMPQAFSATLTETANLGFPSLPSIGGLSSSSPLSPTSLISGTHTIQVWSAGPRHLRVALPVSFGETDLRVNGSQVWLWDSQGQKATKIVLPGHPVLTGHGPVKPGPGATAGPDWAKLSPLQAARKALALAGPTTRVTIPGTTTVAGRNAYQLAIAPKTSQSLVGRILIAIDAKTHLPLSVQIYARGASSPALAVGYTSLTFARPAMSNFAFTPPPGAHVRIMHPQVARVPSKAGLHHGWSGYPPGAMHGRGPLAGAQTFGTGWLSVLAIPGGLHGLPAGISGPAGNNLAVLAALLKVAKPVHGSWGSGRLLRTSLVSVLITSKGQVLIGAVTPAVLYADAAKVK
ncbi:MAG TPA: DUF2092 domain-containing protein [Streptosporangiaceae bacterium]